VCDRARAAAPVSCYSQVDDWGRTVLVCNASQMPVVHAAPPPAPPVAPAAPAPQERRGIVGLVFMPGASSTIGSNFGFNLNTQTSHAVGAVALEVRALSGGGRLRFGFEGGSFGRVIEGGAKYDFFDGSSPIRPFLAVALGGAAIDHDSSWRFQGAVSAGLDLYLSKDFFTTFEVKGRRFAEHSSSSYYGLTPSSLYQTAFFAGLGIYL
jgi:hypothetical protein